jgi:formate hydrogenlyase subunit 4
MENVLHYAIHLALLVLLPPLLLGAINKTKACFAGRVGPPLLQVYADLLKLFRKGSVFSRTTTWVFKAGPVVSLTAVVAAALFVPLGGHRALAAFPGDLIVFAYLLALARFFTASAALDTGSPFEGMGAVREVTFSCLAEPAFFFTLLVAARVTSSLTISQMFGPALAVGWSKAGASLALVVIGWFIVLLAENCRVPFDDPNTHLELTMIHEVMVLDHSGPALGMILYGAALKLFLFASLLVRLLLPISTGSLWLDWTLFVAGVLAVAVVVGVVESVVARLRLVSVPQMLVTASLLAAFSLVLLVRFPR